MGGWLTPKLALLGRATSTWHGSAEVETNTFYGPVVEWWPVNAMYLSGGAGLGVYGWPPFLSRGDDLITGLAFDFRVGVAVLRKRDNDFTISLEAIPGFYGDRSVTGTALVAAWKWY
jgi:hypothetical protein